MAYTPVQYKAKDYGRLKGLHAITDEQIGEHLKLYNGYVTRTNAALVRLAEMANDGKHGDPAYHELKRRLGWEFDGMRLHELYFDNLTPGGKGSPSPDNPLGAAITKTYGSTDAWKADFLGVAKMPGVGWAIATWDAAVGQLMNVWIDRHDIGLLATGRPVLVLDLWEHAFSVYLKPTQRAQYLEDFFANVDWNVVESRVK